jgi:hypothetical protein
MPVPWLLPMAVSRRTRRCSESLSDCAGSGVAAHRRDGDGRIKACVFGLRAAEHASERGALSSSWGLLREAVFSVAADGESEVSGEWR